MTLADECRKWAAEMHRSAEALAEAGSDAEWIDGNRAIANTLAAAADRIDKLEAKVADATSFLEGVIRQHGGGDA